MNVTLCVRTDDGGTVVAISGEVDVCTEAPLQQALLWIIRERGARLMLDVSGVSFMDCAGLRALLATRRRAEMRGGCMRLIATSAAVRRIIELTGTHEALAPERNTTARFVRFLKRTDRMRCADRSVCPPPDAGERAISWCYTQKRMTADVRPGPDRAEAGAARGGANPMTGGCAAACAAARLTSC